MNACMHASMCVLYEGSGVECAAEFTMHLHVRKFGCVQACMYDGYMDVI
jgi:hypothetical protein